MKEAFDQIAQALEILDWHQEQEEMSRMRATVEEGRFFVAFLGQYSAGKSSLINHLLGRELLPHGVRETTAILTYLRYGEREQAVLHYYGGKEEILSMDLAYNIHQQNGQDFEQLEYMELFVNSDLLRSGMILMDTPGINTNIERHERLLNISLAQTARAIYVMGGSPSQIDAELLQGLVKRGISTACVRTHFDLVNPTEENPQQTQQLDRRVLANYGILEEDCWFISNDPQSNYYNEIWPLRQMLSVAGANMQQELEQAAWIRLKTLASLCAKELEERQSILVSLCYQDRSTAEQEEQKLAKQIQELERSAKEKEEQLAQQISEVQHKLEPNGLVARRLDDSLEESAQRIKTSMVENEEEMVTQIHREAHRIMRKLEEEVESACGEMLNESNAWINDILDALKLQSLPQCNFQDLIEQEDEKQEELNRRLRQITEHKEELEKAIQQMEESELPQLLDEIKLLESEFVQAQQEYKKLPPYEPKMIVVNEIKMQPSQIAGIVGSMADWALLFMPGAQISAGLKAMLSSTTGLKRLATLIGGFEKIGNIVQKGDKIKDIAYALNHLSKTYTTARRIQKAERIVDTAVSGAEKAVTMYQKVRNPESTMYQKVRNAESGEAEVSGLLELLSISHWTRKVFSGLDKPPVLKEDTEIAAQYRQMEREVREEMRNSQQRVFQKKRDAQVFRSKEEELKAQREADMLEEKKVQRELERRKEKNRQQLRKTQLESWRADCAQWYIGKLRTQIHTILKNWHKTVPSRVGQYQRERLATVQRRLQDKQSHYQGLLNAPKSENQKRLEQIEALLKKLRMVENHG